MKLVKKHLDALRDGVQLLQLYDAELTDDAIRAVTDAHGVLVYQAKQLEELGVSASNVMDAAARVRHQLESDRPWQAISGLAEDLEQITAAYTSERQRLLQWQEQEAEAGARPREERATASARSRASSHTRCCARSPVPSPTPPPRRSHRR